MDENQRFDIPWHKAFLLIPVVYKVLPMCLELSVTYVSGSYPPIKGEGAKFGRRNKIKGEIVQIILEERASSNRLSLSFSKRKGESGHN